MRQLPPEVAQACYNWKGEIICFKHAGAFVPLAPENTYYQRLIEGIAKGSVRVEQPSITWAIRTFSHAGRHTGYDTECGFIPNDPANFLYTLLIDSITTGICKETLHTDVVAADKSEQITDIIVCVFFDQPWSSVRDSYRGNLCLRPNLNVDPQTFSFCLRNLADTSSKNPLQLLLEHYSCSFTTGYITDIHFQVGVLEIEIPVRDLRKILRGAITEPHNPFHFSLSDQLEMELVRSGRSNKEGPSIQWLIGNTQLYLVPFICDFSNRVVDAFWQEHHGSPLSHQSPTSLQRQYIILQRKRSGQTCLGYYSSSGRGSGYILEGEWSDRFGLNAVSDAPQFSIHPVSRSLIRLRMLIEVGFHMEAVVLANGIVEASLFMALCNSVLHDPTLEHTVRNFGHQMRLQLLERIVGQCDDLYQMNKNKVLIDIAKQLYRHRNDYVHDLALPTRTHLLAYRLQKELESLLRHFSDYLDGQAWLHLMDRISRGESDVRNAVTAFCQENQKAY